MRVFFSLSFIASGVMFLIFLLILGIFKTMDYELYELRDLGIRCMMGAAIPSAMVAGYLGWRMCYRVLIFSHKTKNSANIDRNPVKFFINNKVRLNRIVFYLFFVTAVYMLTAVIFMADIK